MNPVYEILDTATFVPANDSDMKRSNANVNADSSMGAMLTYGSETARLWYKDEVIPDYLSKAMDQGWLYCHDLDFFALTTTCCQIDLGKLFEHGFHTGHGHVRKPQSIRTAAALACIAIQSNQNDQFGGQSCPAFDHYLAPYVKLTYRKYFDELMRTMQTFGVSSSDLSRIPEIAWNKTVEETNQAMEALVTNLNTMNSRAGAQVPFSSLNYGTDTSKWGRQVTRSLLKATWDGLGHGETPIFPVQIFKLKEGVNYNPEDPNYDLFQLAMQVSAKRLFPNFSFLDAPYNRKFLKMDKSGKYDPDTEVAYMGCVDGSAHVWYKVNGGPEQYDEIEKVYGLYRNENVEVYDTFSRDYVSVLTWIRNDDRCDWIDVQFNDGLTLSVTSDHPFPTQRGRVEAKDLRLFDSVPLSLKKGEGVLSVIGIQCTDFRNRFSYDVETTSDHFDVEGINSHNCRTRVMSNVNGPETTGGRGNISFTTINLVKAAIEARGDIDEFYRLVNEQCDLAYDLLMFRWSLQKARHVYNYPFMMGNNVYMNSETLAIDDEVEDALKNGTLSIGFIGLAEAMVALFGKHHGESEDVWEVAYDTISMMREFCDDKTEQDGLNFSLLATPAEGLSGKFTCIDQAKYGIIEGVTDREYYTNSFHIPVYYDIGIAEKIEKEGPFHELCNAGHITYVELDGDTTRNIQAFESVIRCMHDNGVGYGAVNHPIDRCPICGFQGVIYDECPQCHRKEFEAVPEEYREMVDEIRKRGLV